MLHVGLITAHVISAVTAFGLGVSLVARRGSHPVQARLYAVALTLMTLFVTGAVALDWDTLGGVVQALFVTLLALACYVTWRGWRARSRLSAGLASLGGALRDISFALVTLFTAFVVNLVHGLGGPLWLVLVSGILALAASWRVVRVITSRRLDPVPAQPRATPAARTPEGVRGHTPGS